VSASAYTPLAAAFAVSPQNARAHSYGVSLDTSSGSFGTIYTPSFLPNPFALNQLAFHTIFKARAFSSFLRANTIVNNNKVTATVGSTTATFDLSTPADFALFAELGFVYNFLNTIETDSSLSALVVDSVPDFYSFSFSSLKNIKEIYGEKSDIFVASILLVDSAIQQAFSKLDSLYDGRAVSAVACLNTQTILSDQVKNAVYESARHFLQSKEDFDLHFPSLYLRNGNAGQACTKIKNAVGSSAEVHCFTSTYNWVVEQTNVQSTNTTELNVAAFWIFVFFPITFLLIVLTGVVGLCGAGIEASKDSLLFRSAGRHH